MRYLRNPQNVGLGATRNRGLKATQSRYVLCLDADDKIAPDYLPLCQDVLSHAHVSTIDAHVFMEEEPIHIGGSIRPYQGDMTPGADSIDVYKLKNGIGRMPLGPILSEEDGRNRYLQLCSSSPYRREVWERIGGYDESETMRYMWEDFDFWLRAAKEKFVFKKAVGAKLYVRVHQKHKTFYEAERLGMSGNDFWWQKTHEVFYHIYRKHPELYIKCL